MTKDFSYLINVYKQTLNDKKDFIKTRSIHWDNFYEKNNKFFDIKNLINFRKNQILSKGLDDAMNLQNKLDLIEEESLVVTLEAGSITHWQKYIKNKGFNFGIDQFGESAPYKQVYDHFNLNEENIVNYIQKKLRE